MAEYSEQVRAVALAHLLAGQSFSEVSRLIGVPIGTLKSWKQRHADAADPSVFVDAVDASTASTKRERIGALLLDYAISTLEALNAQQKVFAHETWIREQSADSLAILHGVSFDKVVRLLEALEEQDSNTPELP